MGKEIILQKAFPSLIKIGRKIGKHSNIVLTILAILGLTGTAALAVDATVKAVKICEEKQIKGRKEIIKTVWKLYIPALGFFIVTTSSIVLNAHINAKNAKRLATVTGLYAMSQTDLKNLKEKTKDIVGKGKAEKIDDDIVKDRLNQVVPTQQNNIIDTGHGDKLFMEWLTGQLIRTSPEYVEAVSERIDNRMGKELDGIVEVGGIYLTEFNINPDCWVGRAIWDVADLLQNGIQKFEIDCREIQWMEVNGKQEMVGIIRPPEPTGA